MGGKRFTLDTNILVYAVDTAAAERHRVALKVVELAMRHDCVLVLQALCEFYATMTRKGKISAHDARAQIDDWQALFPVVSATASTLSRAVRAVEQDRFSFWDAMLWATARDAGVSTLLSEDFQHGRVFDGVEFVNPFSASSVTKLFR